MRKTNKLLSPIFWIVFSLFFLAHSPAQIVNLDDNGSKRIFALVIGISDYQYIDDLDYAHNDAKDFANFLKSKDGLGLPDENVVVFLNEQATKNDIIFNGFEWLNSELREGDEAYIYFSGHGDITNKDVENLAKTGYLLTYETRKPFFEPTALRMDYVLERFHTISTQKNAVVRLILDVCHSGFGLEKGVITLLEIDKNLDEEKQIIITSCKDNEYSWEYPALKNGCFSYFFIEGLKGAADKNKDNNITLEELEEYSSANVKRYVRKKSNEKFRQSPQFKGEYYHTIAKPSGDYTEIPIDFENLPEGSGKGKGTRKGIDTNEKKSEIKAEKILKKTADKSYSGKEIQKKFKHYSNQPEETAKDRAKKREMKRELISVVVDNADRSLTAYFEKGDELWKDPFNTPASEYYLIAANLLGEDHFLYEDLIGKYYFMEAMKLKTTGSSDYEEVINKLKTSLEIEPDASYTLNELGNIYFKKGNYKEALNYYKRANKVSPEWSKPLENKIKVNKKLESMQAAQNILTAKTPSAQVPTPYEVNADTKSEITTKKSSLSANYETNDAQDNVFHIQLAAAKEYKPEVFKQVDDLGTINPKLHPNKPLINIWLGPFETEKEAKLKLEKVKEKVSQMLF